MARLLLDGAAQEYREFLETRYRDATWDNPLNAWVMGYLDQASPDIRTSGPTLYRGVVSVSVVTGDYYDSGGHDGASTEELEIALPDWAQSLATFYDAPTPPDGWTRDQALTHFAEHVSASAS